MSGIERVGALDSNILEIQLDNGSTILLNAELLLAKPEFAHLAIDDRILYPHTDGTVLYWNNGPKIGLEEIIALLGTTGR